jgi:hypothetical protein
MKSHVHVWPCLAAALALSNAPAAAITAEDVMAKMNVEKRVGYLTGLIDMLAYQAAATGNNKKAICITDSFYREQKEQSWKRLLTVLEEYSDKRPEILVTALAKQLCKD